MSEVNEVVKSLNEQFREAEEKQTKELSQLFDLDVEYIKKLIIDKFRHSEDFINKDSKSIYDYLQGVFDETEQLYWLTVDIIDERHHIERTKDVIDNATKSSEASVSDVMCGTLTSVLNKLGATDDDGDILEDFYRDEH